MATASPSRTEARLVVVAHGTRNPVGNHVAARIAELAGERCGVQADVAYVELCEPLLGTVLAGPVERSSVVVPLLLTTGYHVRVDLPDAVASAYGPTSLTAPLGPDPLLAAAQVERLVQAGARRGQPVTMVAAGSNDPTALPELQRAADLLSGAWGGPVRLATLGGLGPRPEDVVRPGDAVSPYLLAAGFFATRCADGARAAGAEMVADVIGVHERVIDLVAARYRAAELALELSGSR
ncbi:MAG: sirohydrochlorin chelatase [Nocardioides sp.]